jgi:hypothetical protein
MKTTRETQDVIQHWVGYATTLIPVTDMRTRAVAQCKAIEHVGRVLALDDLAATQLVAPIFAEIVGQLQ